MRSSGVERAVNRLPNTLFHRAVTFALGVYGVIISAALLLEPLRFMPAEDAVILWMYSRNLALHGAITYFAGGPHAEGATDFAWMIALAGAMKLGPDPFFVTALASVAALVLLAILLIRLAALRVTVWRVLLVAGAAGCSPQIFAVASGFATLIDAMLLALTVYFCVRQKVAVASLTAFVFCLFRPDGLVFALPLLLFLLFENSKDERWKMILLLFVLPGLLYEAWRVWYFREMFPLPFLVKADAHRVLHLFVAASVRTSLVYLAFALVVVFMAWAFTKEKFAGKPLLVSLVAVPTCFYWCVRLDQNVGFRFFYYLPLSAALLLALNWQALSAKRPVAVCLTALVWLVLLFQPLRRERRTFIDLQAQDLRQIAIDLSRIPVHGSLISSEAGILPFYSGWPAIDPWGLNTAEFAHRFFQPSDVARLSPALIHIHPDIGESCVTGPDWRTPYALRSWRALTRNVVAGAEAEPYDVWQVSYGSESYRLRKRWPFGEGDKTCWFVRRGTPAYDAISAVLRNHHGLRISPLDPPRKAKGA